MKANDKNIRFWIQQIIFPIFIVQSLNAQPDNLKVQKDSLEPFVMVLGIAQDAGYPQIGCLKSCCETAWADSTHKTWVSSIAIVDPKVRKWWLVDATPDIKEQLHFFQKTTQGQYPFLPERIFLTHAHMGHYTGLLQFGREAMNTNLLIVNVMARMGDFLRNQAPWSQLVKLENIRLWSLVPTIQDVLSEDIFVEPFLVPHRDEFSETVGFHITAGKKKYLFVPDIDKWSKWNRNILEEVQKVDYAFLDGTFYNENELAFRKIAEVPHPTIEETMKLFVTESSDVKKKIHFIHLNHTNPLLWSDDQQKLLHKAGYKIAEQGKKY